MRKDDKEVVVCHLNRIGEFEEHKRALEMNDKTRR
jgi:hypothetical protein